MGVLGLTTYLRENHKAISRTLTFPNESLGPIPIVVDGWSFIYNLDRASNLPWVYGGEYAQFHKLVITAVQAWINVGLKIFFVFDGAYPELKFPTLVSRLGRSHIQPSLLFFRTSAVSRATSRFLNETRIIPPLAYTACINALLSLKKTTKFLELHFADEEGDPYAVELAGKLGGYVAGNDSDFVVLNTEGYLGYIPLEEMMWYADVPTEDPTHDNDSGFQEVRRPKAKRQVIDTSVGIGVMPPDADSPTMTVTIYAPEALASHLKIPVTLLPLLGSLIGNDFSHQSETNRKNIQSLFFEKRLSLSQRINRVATVLQTVLSPLSQKRKKSDHQVGSVMDLIDRAVKALLTRLPITPGSGEVDGIINQIVEATLQYAIPKRDDGAEGSGLPVCALHKDNTCPLLPFVSRRAIPTPDAPQEKRHPSSALLTIRKLFLESYRNGHLAPKIMDCLVSGTFWPRLFLENPDLETVSCSIGRPIREWMFSVLHDAVGLPDPPGEEEVPHPTSPQSDNEDDLDEVIDVVESDSGEEDLLAPLKGELHRLHKSDLDSDSVSGDSATSYIAPPYPKKPPIVTEYVRRGTRVAQEDIAVRSLRDLYSTTSLPEFDTDQNLLLLRSDEERFTVLLQALHSDIPAIRALLPGQLLFVLALRWTVRTVHFRAEVTGSKDREQERWTKKEAISFLASFEISGHSSLVREHPPIMNRNVQLTAQALEALEDIEHFSQILLLTDILPSSVHYFSGRSFHEYLCDDTALVASVSPPLIEASTSGLEFAYRQERLKMHKKLKRNHSQPSPSLRKENSYLLLDSLRQ